MATVTPEQRRAIRRFNDRMIALRQAGKTNSEAYKNFATASETSRYRNVFRTDSNGNLVLRTDYAHLSDAELQQVENIMDRTLEAGATTLKGLQKEFTDFMREYGQQIHDAIIENEKLKKEDKKKGVKKKRPKINVPSQEEYEKIKDSIDEESLHNVYYDEKTHQTTAAVENGLTKAEAMNMLALLVIKGKVSDKTGKIYPQSIRAALDRKYME